MTETPLGHKIKEKRLRVKQGSSISLQLTFTNPDGTAKDVSDRSFMGQVRKEALSSTVQASFSFDMTNATTGIVIATLAGSSTAAMTTGETELSKDSQYWYDIRYTRLTIDTYPIQGPLTLIPRVTR